MLHSVYLSARLSLPVTLVTFELTIFLLFFTPLLLLNCFLFNLFLFLLKRVRGGGGGGSSLYSVRVAKKGTFLFFSVREKVLSLTTDI